MSGYFATWGPKDGPIRASSNPPTMGVQADPDAPGLPVGTAFGAGFAPHKRGAVALFRLVIRKVELPDPYVCASRRFVPLEEWEEREAIREG